jgi:hypothetical protein
MLGMRLGVRVSLDSHYRSTLRFAFVLRDAGGSRIATPWPPYGTDRPLS